MHVRNWTGTKFSLKIGPPPPGPNFMGDQIVVTGHSYSFVLLLHNNDIVMTPKISQGAFNSRSLYQAEKIKSVILVGKQKTL